MQDNCDLRSWECNGIDNRELPEYILSEGTVVLEDAIKMISLASKWYKNIKSEAVILPFVQNIESIALGTDIKISGKYWVTGEYKYSNIEELENIDFKITDKKLIETLLSSIQHSDMPVVLEVMAPFSIIAALVDPFILYGLMADESGILSEILDKIAYSQAEYIDKAIKCGTSIISIADPLGVIDIVGPDAFSKYSGKAVVKMLKLSKLVGCNSLVHICGKLSNSLINTGLAIMRLIKIEEKSTYTSALLSVIDNSEIKFIGQGCIHVREKNVDSLYAIEFR